MPLGLCRYKQLNVNMERYDDMCGIAEEVV